MNKHAIAGLLFAASLTLASCGGTGGGEGGDMQDMDHGGSSGDGAQQSTPRQETTGGDMAGMDNADTGMDETTGTMEGMDHGDMDSEEMASMSRDMVRPGGEYSDRAFIDAMVPHHEGAVEMAQVALARAEHQEIRNLAEDVVSAQRSEIELFGQIREREYGSAESTMEMNEQDMEAMGMSDPQMLAQADPFDKAFIDEMIPHHESAIAMAEVARAETDDPEIRKIAEDIISAQDREIERMHQWRKEWYPEG
ncbi:hypothetical protein BH24ACT20_BH24ACT20_00540 [soil metagenome]